MQDGRGLIAGRYQIEDKIGSGSYATTYTATDRSLNRTVAVKVLHPDRVENPDDLANFQQEARIAAMVTHPNIVQVYDSGVRDNHAFLVMEWVGGKTLKDEINSKRRITVDHALDLADGILAGLSHVHAIGIVHRDVKPQNVLLNEFGTPKLTDFGVACAMGDSGRDQQGVTMGTAAYMAPEQARGRALSGTSDIYSVGVILYEMLTGRLPFTGDDPLDVIHKHVHEPVVRPKRINPNIPGSVEQLVLKALAKDPEQRYASAAEMRAAFRHARQESSEREAYSAFVAPVGRMERIQELASHRLTWIAASGVIALMMLLGSAARNRCRLN
jgi:eukaryotic-like serine/threonine-protein kinase